MRLSKPTSIALLVLIAGGVARSLPNSVLETSIVEARFRQSDLSELPPLSTRFPGGLWPIPGWALLFATGIVILLPIGAVCAVLAAFYSIVDRALTIWANSPPANQVTIETTSMRLEFGCSIEPVPWEFIAEFVASQMDAVNRGFAASFEREYWSENGDRTRLCYVGFRVLREGEMAIPPRINP